MKHYLVLLLVFNFALAQNNAKKLVWEENFDGNDLDEKVWNFELGNGCPNICGWGNNEAEIYTKDNHKVENGFLTITAKYDRKTYTSTRITTKNKKEFQYGRIETRAKLPQGKGIWPAFWMLGSNISEVGWPKSGEIDILEYIGKEPGQVFTSLHTQDSHGNTINTKKTKIETIDWDKDKIAFFVDSNLVYTFQPETKNENTWPFNQPFYFLINMAIGGNFGGPSIDNAIFPQQYTIDYIKVYQ